MSSHAATAPDGLPARPALAATDTASATSSAANKALVIGLVGIALTFVGFFISGAQVIAMSWLVGVTYWTAMAIGFLLLVLIHHVVDASWSVVIRRQWEHGLSAFKWLALLFAPLLISVWTHPGLVWPWMDLSHPIHGGTVGTDVLYAKKSGFLNRDMFTGMTVAFFGGWMWLSYRLRKASFSQDSDGSASWTFMNRKTAAFGIPIAALTLTFAAVYWIKSLEYHWFSTMFGVWFFANCVRGGLSLGIIIMVWLLHRGDYKGILNTNHLHCIATLAFAFTVFWAYVTFSQYFLIWNANVPEETFWYNIREVNHDGTPNQWKYIGIIVILFGHFVVPFLLMLSYRFKTTPHIIRRIAFWILGVILVDLCYNILPALKDPVTGDPQPFFSITLLWVLTSVVGVGGVCVWSFLKSFPTTKLIPIRDPRIVESLTPL